MLEYSKTCGRGDSMMAAVGRALKTDVVDATNIVFSIHWCATAQSCLGLGVAHAANNCPDSLRFLAIA